MVIIFTHANCHLCHSKAINFVIRAKAIYNGRKPLL